jgi:hypothetical protein
MTFAIRAQALNRISFGMYTMGGLIKQAQNAKEFAGLVQ